MALSSSPCNLCPRECGADRSNGSAGACGVSSKIKIARAELHFWEEPCISGDSLETRVGGSGTVFFSGCPLKCVFCQNKEISHGGFGKEISNKRLVEIFLELQQKGAYNINLVTASQYTDSIINAVYSAKERGLTIPILYNSSGYEKAEAIKRLENTVDIYMPDFKYMDNALAKKYSGVSDYSLCATTALDEMVRQKGECVFDEYGIMQSGVLVRHLQLPGCLEDSKAVISHLYSRYKDKIYISLMSQYTPFGDLDGVDELKAPLSKKEYDALVNYALSIGVENGFLQEGEAATESFIPPFDLTGV